jgi:nitrate reductase NapD
LRNSQTDIDRRDFLGGRARKGDRVFTPPGREIASILVRARPERLAEVESAIVAMPGCEIHGRDESGKLVVVVDAADSGSIGSTLTAIALAPHVLSAALVFHATDAA